MPVVHLTDFWTGEDYGFDQEDVTFRRLPPHVSKLLVVSPTEG